MTEHTRSRVDRTREYLLESELPEDTKDGLQSLLDAASHAANGTSDRVGSMADAILALSLHEVRQAVRAPAVVRAAVEAHAKACPLSMGGAKGAILGLLMRPYPWIFLSVAIFSPNFPAVVAAVRHFFEAGKPVAAICHAAQLLAGAGVLKGRTCSAYPACRAEVELAGGTYADIAVDKAHTDGNLVSAPAWPAHPDWIAQFLVVLGTRISH